MGRLAEYEDLMNILDHYKGSIQAIYLITKENIMMYMEETNNSYTYYIGIPGIKNNDIDISVLPEKDFFTLKVIIDGKKHMIVRQIKEVIPDETLIGAKINKGVLTIDIPKADPIKI
jgi:HSP20 family molecular chaperone IbpA